MKISKPSAVSQAKAACLVSPTDGNLTLLITAVREEERAVVKKLASKWRSNFIPYAQCLLWLDDIDALIKRK